MAKTKIEKIAGIDEQIAQLANQKKRLVQEQKAQERKERTTRLCKRAGLLESLLPETITLTDEQFKTFLEKAVTNDYGRNMIARIVAQGGNTTTAKLAATAQGNGTAAARSEGGAGETAV